MLENASVAAATAIVGYDILQGVTWNSRSWPRRIMGIGVCGSAAAGDCAFDLRVNGVRVSNLRNLATGWPTKDHIFASSFPVPANALIEAVMTIAPTTNPINVIIAFLP